MNIDYTQMRGIIPKEKGCLMCAWSGEVLCEAEPQRLVPALEHWNKRWNKK